MLLKDLNGANLLVQTDWSSLFSEVSMLTCAPGVQDMLHLCISNHLKTKYPLFDLLCIRNPIVLFIWIPSAAADTCVHVNLQHSVNFICVHCIHLFSCIPHSVCPPSAHGDRWADPLPRCRWDHYWGEKTLGSLPVWLPKSAPAANKNTSRGTRTSERRCFCRVKHFPRYKTTQGGRLDEATHSLILYHVTIVSEEKAQHPRNNEHYFCNIA